MDFVTLSIGLILGIVIGAGAIFIYFKLNNKNEVDIESYSKNLKDLKEAIEGYEDTNSEDRGAVKILLEAVQTGNKEVKEEAEKKRQIEFSEKIDELNQETDILLDEIDKWQT